jgi:hypothetical protein
MATVEAVRVRDDVTPRPHIDTNSHTPPPRKEPQSDNESAIDDAEVAESVFSEDLGGATLERKLTNDAHTTVPRPGDVRINVKGAFIIEDDEEPGTPESEKEKGDFEEEGYTLERRGIRLPNHRQVVSHIAVDVRLPLPYIHAKEKKTVLTIYVISRSAVPLPNSSTSPQSQAQKPAAASISSNSKQTR